MLTDNMMLRYWCPVYLYIVSSRYIRDDLSKQLRKCDTNRSWHNQCSI